MITNSQNHLLNQMQALEALARGNRRSPRSSWRPGPSFGELMQQAIDQVNETQMQASSLTKAFELGERSIWRKS